MQLNRSILTILFVNAIWLFSFAQTARFQLIHCSADSSLQMIDVWMDSIKVFDDLEFQSSSSFLSAAAGTNHILFLCSASSIDTSNSYFKDSIQFEANGRSQIFINGMINTTYSPFQELGFKHFQATRIQSQFSGYTDLLFYNGVSDFNDMEIFENSVINENLESGLSYDQFTEYRSVESLNYLIQLRENGKDYGIREVKLKLTTLGLADSAVSMVMTGFKNPSLNNNGSSVQAFIVPNSGGHFTALENSFAQVQFIHNSPDPLMQSADFYVGSNKVIDDMKFRNATSYFNVASGVLKSLGVAHSNSASATDTLLAKSMVLEADKSYIVVLNGLESTSIIPFEPLSLSLIHSRKVAGLGYNTDILFVHGSTDAGLVNIQETDVLKKLLFENQSYGEISGYRSIPSAIYSIELMDEAGASKIKTYVTDYSINKGSAETWVLSGFLDSLNNASTNHIGIWVASSAGGQMNELHIPTGITPIPHNGLNVFPNPCRGLVTIESIETIDSIELFDSAGRSVLVSHSTSLDLTHLPSGIYILIVQTHSHYSVQNISIVN